jgi:uncharacterized cysteine cluster protein YcgN (CxxCxxCC family)
MDHLNSEEWEALCDRCGLCCLQRLVDEDSDASMTTRVVCHLFDLAAGQCSDYSNRKSRVPDCFQLSPTNVRDCWWLPDTCGYRRMAEGRDLPYWHPLLTGDRSSMDRLGISLKGRQGIRKDNEVPFHEWQYLPLKD